MTRRVVTAYDGDGKAVILSDGEPPRTVRRKHLPGFIDTLVWATPAQLSLSAEVTDPTPSRSSWIPGPGETVALVVTFSPDAVFADPEFDAAAVREEHLAATPGLAELFEEDAPGMHTTPSVDYAVVLSGSLLLDLDNGETTELSVGDVVVQNGVRHAWRNPTSEPAVAFFVLVGCQP
jgi:mannose-6-phosphate isomerase-like protein (cupin superfamily)